MCLSCVLLFFAVQVNWFFKMVGVVIPILVEVLLFFLGGGRTVKIDFPDVPK